MAEVKWIKIVTDIFDNRKIKQIEKLPEGDGIIVIWFKLLSLAGNVNDGGAIYLTKEIPYTEEMLAVEFNRPIQTLKLALVTFQKFRMIEIIDDVLYVSSWEKYQNTEALEKIREQNRIRQARYKEKQKAIESNVTVTLPSQPSHATDIDKDIDNIYSAFSDDKNAEKEADSKEIQEFFESVWKLYPNKKGKGQVSKSKKKELHAIGYEQLERCINRYLKELKKDEWRKPQNGSTFFSSGYIDYLDENYGEQVKVSERGAKGGYNKI